MFTGCGLAGHEIWGVTLLWETVIHDFKGSKWRWRCDAADTSQGVRRRKQYWDSPIKEWKLGTSLVAKWLRIHLPRQGTWVQALVWEDPTCRGATKPVRHNYWARALEPANHNYWACALELVNHNYWARVPQLLKPAYLEPVLRNKRSHRNEKPVHRTGKSSPCSLQLEKAHAQQHRPNAAKNK